MGELIVYILWIIGEVLTLGALSKHENRLADEKRRRKDTTSQG
jgi:hypothetical protein